MRFPKHLLENSSAESTSSGGTATEAPAAAPAAAPASPAPAAPAPAAAAAPEAGVDNTDWAAESDLGDENVENSDIKPGPAAKPAAEPTPAAQPAAAAPAAAEPAKPVAEAPKPAAQPAAAAPAEPAKPAAVVAETPEAKALREKTAKEAEEKLFGQLQEYYKLPEDLAAKLQTEPEVVLPVLAAKVHQAVARSMEFMLANQLPQYMAQIQGLQAAESGAKNAFYEAWPQLKAYEQQVLQAGKLYRGMNPNATPQEAIKAIGTIVATSLGLAIAPGGPAAAPAPKPAAPAPAFQPTGSSGARSPAPASGENEFTQLVMGEDE